MATAICCITHVTSIDGKNTLPRLMEIDREIPPIRRLTKTADQINRLSVGDFLEFDTQREAKRFADALRYRRMKYATRKVDECYCVWRLS